jgi:hypothetical protein
MPTRSWQSRPKTGFFSLDMNRPDAPEVDRRTFFETIVGFPAEAPAWQDYDLPKEQFWARIERIRALHAFSRLSRLLSALRGALRQEAVGDKAPLHCFYMDRIEALVPESHFIHILRDGRDVCLSLRQMWFSPGWEVEVQARYWCDFVSGGAPSRCRVAPLSRGKIRRADCASRDRAAPDLHFRWAGLC